MDLLFARLQMAWSLAFHIVFAVIGIGMPLLMVIAEARHLRTGDPLDLRLAKRWAKGTAIFFAVGAVSGTVLSFELGLLWPGFMEFAGAVIGLPFALEGFAFFTEAIFLGLYLYGWGRLRPAVHLACGAMVALSGLASAVFVVMANAWMNAPQGFRVDPATGLPADVDPWAAMLNPAWKAEVLHMTLAAYLACAFGVATVHAARLLRRPGDPFHRRALAIAMPVAIVTALLQPLSGDYAAKVVADTQPAKLAAMEGQFATEAGAPLRLFGWPDEAAGVTRWALEIPYALSFLAHGDPHATVVGLDAIPEDRRPPVALTHVAFQVMVLCGLYLVAVAAWFLASWWRGKRLPEGKALLRTVVAAGPLAFLALEAGWIVTEVGRQPWVVAGVLRTADAATPAPNLWVPFTAFAVVYLWLAWLVWRLMRAQIAAAEREDAAA